MDLSERTVLPKVAHRLELYPQGVHVSLLTSPDVFTPSIHGTKAAAENIQINKGDRVLDVGTGTGFLGILAAKFGAEVSAVDISPEAVALAKENARLNNVTLDVREGDLFAPFRGETFDIIIANVPQEIISPNLQKSMSKKDVVSMHGGDEGSEILMRVLREAPMHMKPNGRLYVGVFTMVNYRKTLEYMVKNYRVTLKNFYSGPVKPFVYEDLEWYLNNPNVTMKKMGDEYYADVFALELTQK